MYTDEEGKVPQFTQLNSKEFLNFLLFRTIHSEVRRGPFSSTSSIDGVVGRRLPWKMMMMMISNQ